MVTMISSFDFRDKTIRMDEVASVWWRRPQPFGIPAEVRDPAVRHFAMSEAATALQDGAFMARNAIIEARRRTAR